MTPSEAQRRADEGDVHADDVTVAQACAAIRRYEFVRFDAIVSGERDELGPEHHITSVSLGRLNADWPTSLVLEHVAKADRIWWQGGRLQFTVDHHTYRLQHVAPITKASCGYCGHTYHAGACDLDGIPSYKAGRSA